MHSTDALSSDPQLAAWRELVQNACVRSTMGADFFTEHVLMVERFVRRLAPQLGARLEIVQPAAILHDLAAIEDFSRVAEHHTLGAARARELLMQQGLGHADAVAACIARHTTPLRQGEGNAEEICLSNADALAQLANPAYWLYYAHRVRGLAFQNARTWYRDLVQNRWDRLHEAARDLAAPHFTRARGACEID